MKGWTKTAIVLANIGAINWGLWLLGWDAVDNLIASWSIPLAKVVYTIIALCGLYGLYAVFKK